MNEVEKMYENAEVSKKCIDKRYEKCTGVCYDCKYFIYPPFTAEKQIELIKLIANRKGYPDYEYFGTLFDDYIQLLDFNEALAKLVNNLWQDLTDVEKAQVKGILE